MRKLDVRKLSDLDVVGKEFVVCKSRSSPLKFEGKIKKIRRKDRKLLVDFGYYEKLQKISELEFYINS